jgi:hypothetical protein
MVVEWWSITGLAPFCTAVSDSNARPEEVMVILRSVIDVTCMIGDWNALYFEATTCRGTSNKRLIAPASHSVT